MNILISLDYTVAVVGAPLAISALVAAAVAVYATGLAVVGGIVRSHTLVDAALMIAFGALTVFGAGLLSLGLSS